MSKHARRPAEARAVRTRPAPAKRAGGVEAGIAVLVCVVATGAAVLERVWFGHAWGEAASYGPFNFAMANHENADGGPNRDHPLLERCNEDTTARLAVGQLDLECPAVYDLYVHGYSIGARWLIAHPVAALDLVTRKLAFTVGFLAHGYLIDDIGPDVDGTRRRVDLVDPEREWLIPVHLALIAAGVFVLRKHAAALGIVLAGLAGLVGSTVLFYGYVRLGAVVVATVVTLVVTLTLWDGAQKRSSRALVLDGARTASGALIQDETLEVRRVH
jgi:hypothetical protein